MFPLKLFFDSLSQVILPLGGSGSIPRGTTNDFKGFHHSRSSNNPASRHAFKKGALRKLSSFWNRKLLINMAWFI